MTRIKYLAGLRQGQRNYRQKELLFLGHFRLPPTRGLISCRSQISISWNGGSQDIALTTTDCYFGGFRSWFQCSWCDRRVAILYLPFGAKVFACRYCYSLTYQSCQNSKNSMEGLLRLVKLQDRLEKITNEKGRRGKRKQAKRLAEKLDGIEDFYSWM